MRRSTLSLAAVFAFAAACRAPRASAPAAGERAIAWRYEVTAGEGAQELSIDARFAAGAVASFGLLEACGSFVRDLELEGEDGAYSPVAQGADGWSLEPCAVRDCHLRYRFLLRDAAAAIDDADRAKLHGADAIESPPGAFLIHPREVGPESSYRFHVTSSRDTRFVSGVHRVGDASSSTYEAPAWLLEYAPPSAFGALTVLPIRIGGATFELARMSGALSRDDAGLSAWVEHSAGALVDLYRGFPIDRVLLLVEPAEGDRLEGITFGNGGASIRLSLGHTVDPEGDEGWILVHELLHVAFPSLDREHNWLEEGISTYVEPLARVRKGQISVDKVWGDMIDGMPQGLPEPGDQGLDRTHTWGRTYWGGAIFCLLADVAIRTKTSHTFEDVLRAMAAAGGNVSMNWELEKVIEIGDRANGLPILESLYRRQALEPDAVDLPALWKSLGVSKVGDRVVYDDAAPLAPIRKAITAGG